MWTPAIPACLHVYSLTFLRGRCLGAGWTQSNSELHVWTFPTAAEYKKINENKNSVCTEQGMKALCSQGRGRKRAIALNYFYNWSAIVPGLSFSPMSGKVFNNSSHFWNHLRLVDALFMWLPPVDLPIVDGTRLRLGSLRSGRHNQDGNVSHELWRWS